MWEPGSVSFLPWHVTRTAEVYGTEVSSVAIQIAKEQYDLDTFQGAIETFTGRESF